MATSNVAESVRWEGTEIGDGINRVPRTASGSSRRRFCRIYPERDHYALAHDFSYRVFHLQGGEAHWTPASAQRHGPMGSSLKQPGDGRRRERPWTGNCDADALQAPIFTYDRRVRRY